MTLAFRLEEYVRACFTGLWIQSHEPQDALQEIAQLCRQNRWTLAAWDIDQGLSLTSRHADTTPGLSATDPLAAIRALGSLAVPDGTSLLVLRNFHRFMNSVDVIQALETQLIAGRLNGTFVVILSPVVNVPVELERQFAIIEHDLPGRDQLAAIARGIATEAGELPEESALAQVLDAASGLTRIEAENAFSLSLVRNKRIAADTLWEIKSGMLKKYGLLTLHRGGETFAELGGLEALKQFCTRALRPDRPAGVRARGVLLLGPPGSGKAQPSHCPFRKETCRTLPHFSRFRLSTAAFVRGNR